MSKLLALAVFFQFAGCASAGDQGSVRASSASAVADISYFDRNGDGTSDFELHRPAGCDDCDWALVDGDFDGRYDTRVVWSFGVEREAADLQVPIDVPLTAGQPPVSGWAD